MKIYILKKLISKKGFFDRERLIRLAEEPLFKVILQKVYKKFLKQKKKEVVARPKTAIEQISACLPQINFGSKVKAFFSKRNTFKTIKTITNIL